MFKDLLVPITNTSGDAHAVAAAAALAGEGNGHLTLLEFVDLPMPVPGPWGSGELALGEIYDSFRAEAEKDAQAWKERLAREAPDLPSGVRVIESIASESATEAARQARYADLSVIPMAGDQGREALVIREFFNSLLLESGRPVLLVPAAPVWRKPRHVVVAWQPKREATRAIHDAMPFLRAAESVDLVEVGDERDEEGPSPGSDIAAHLARHGVKVRAVLLPAGDSVSASLLAHAHATGAGLIVTGGFGHSRFREWVMGGVTADLLATPCAMPILFSH